MVAQQEAIVGENNMENVKNMLMIIKGKRTKRARPLSPLALTMSTSTATQESGSTSYEGAVANSVTTEEEEDMAHCLILLAQGSTNNNNNNKNKANGTITTSYECKTCNKSFQSFQALGGHRASHKKPKFINVAESEIREQFNNVDLTLHMANYMPSTTIVTTTSSSSVINAASSVINTKVKVHECSICKATFSSGQALGGHMRRHRPIGMSSNNPNHPGTAVKAATPEEKTTRNLLSLDLNLPAPEEDYVQRNFVFPTNDKTLVFNASSLVDCHY